jgi:hypothetical protein
MFFARQNKSFSLYWSVFPVSTIDRKLALAYSFLRTSSLEGTGGGATVGVAISCTGSESDKGVSEEIGGAATCAEQFSFL